MYPARVQSEIHFMQEDLPSQFTSILDPLFCKGSIIFGLVLENLSSIFLSWSRRLVMGTCWLSVWKKFRKSLLATSRKASFASTKRRDRAVLTLCMASVLTALCLCSPAWVAEVVRVKHGCQCPRTILIFVQKCTSIVPVDVLAAN